MNPQTRIRAARVLIPIAILIGVAAAVAGVWWAVAGMALLIISQGLNLRASQGKG
jgi:hypothetical protein